MSNCTSVSLSVCLFVSLSVCFCVHALLFVCHYYSVHFAKKERGGELTGASKLTDFTHCTSVCTYT